MVSIESSRAERLINKRKRPLLLLLFVLYNSLVAPECLWLSIRRAITLQLRAKNPFSYSYSSSFYRLSHFYRLAAHIEFRTYTMQAKATNNAIKIRPFFFYLLLPTPVAAHHLRIRYKINSNWLSNFLFPFFFFYLFSFQVLLLFEHWIIC